MICDTDITVNEADMLLAFEVWKRNTNSIVGLFPAAHYEENGSWRYIMHPDKQYSLILSNWLFMRSEFLYLYHCLLPSDIMDFIKENSHCEDILMNCMITGLSRSFPFAIIPENRSDYSKVSDRLEQKEDICLQKCRQEFGFVLRNTSSVIAHFS